MTNYKSCTCNPEDVGPMMHATGCLTRVDVTARERNCGLGLGSAPVESETTRRQLQAGLDAVANVLGRPALFVGEHAEAVQAAITNERRQANQWLVELHNEKAAHAKLKAHYDDWLDRIINGRGDPEKEAALDTIRSCMEEFVSRCEKYQTELSKSQQKVSELETRIAELQCGR